MGRQSQKGYSGIENRRASRFGQPRVVPGPPGHVAPPDRMVVLVPGLAQEHSDIENAGKSEACLPGLTGQPDELQPRLGCRQ